MEGERIYSFIRSYLSSREVHNISDPGTMLGATPWEQTVGALGAARVGSPWRCAGSRPCRGNPWGCRRWARVWAGAPRLAGL